jgi:hypothetical protein
MCQQQLMGAVALVHTMLSWYGTDKQRWFTPCCHVLYHKILRVESKQMTPHLKGN